MGVQHATGLFGFPDAAESGSQLFPCSLVSIPYLQVNELEGVGHAGMLHSDAFYEHISAAA